MGDLRPTELGTIAVCAALVSVSLFRQARRDLGCRALTWRRGCPLREADFPGAFRMGVMLTVGLALGLMATGGTALLALLRSVP